MDSHLSIGDVAARSGFSASAVRFYEREGLIGAERTAGNQRLFRRDVLRRLAFIRVAQKVGLKLEEIAEALASLPSEKTPTPKDWGRLTQGWQDRIEERILLLETLREGLSVCIGCGCLSLRTCALANPNDEAASEGPGARYLPGD